MYWRKEQVILHRFSDSLAPTIMSHNIGKDYTVHVHNYEYIRVHKQIVQYGRLAENRQYTYTSSEAIVIKIETMLKSNKINNNNVLKLWNTSLHHIHSICLFI